MGACCRSWLSDCWVKQGQTGDKDQTENYYKQWPPPVQPSLRVVRVAHLRSSFSAPNPNRPESLNSNSPTCIDQPWVTGNLSADFRVQMQCKFLLFFRS